MPGMPHLNDPVRLKALATGEKTFEAAPCKNGGHTLRYVSTGVCITCVSDRYKARRMAQGHELRPPKSPTARKRNTYAENQRRAEREAKRRREMIGSDVMKQKRFWGFGPAMLNAMQSEQARGRSAYLDQRIREGANLIRKTGLE